MIYAELFLATRCVFNEKILLLIELTSLFFYKVSPVGIASVMSYLKSCKIDFDFLDIDINDMEDVAIRFSRR